MSADLYAPDATAKAGPFEKLLAGLLTLLLGLGVLLRLLLQALV
jgi:hypothetical protein